MMRPTYTIDLEHGCIFIKWSGNVTAHDAIAFNLELVQDPDYRSELNRLIDLRGASVEASADEIEDLARVATVKVDAAEGHRKMAALVGHDLEYGLVRMLHSMADQTRADMRPFRRLDEALVWLGLSETLGDPFETMHQG